MSRTVLIARPIDTTVMDQEEAAFVAEALWWSIADLRAIPASEAVIPAGLAELAAGLLRDGTPLEPAHLPWSR